MAPKTDRVINSFVKVIKKSFPSCLIFLFGSRAKKTAKKSSDYDFLLVSPAFKKWEWEERSANIYYLKRHIPAAMDIICLTPKEFEQKKKQIGVIQEAVREGIEITPAG